MLPTIGRIAARRGLTSITATPLPRLHSRTVRIFQSPLTARRSFTVSRWLRETAAATGTSKSAGSKKTKTKAQSEKKEKKTKKKKAAPKSKKPKKRVVSLSEAQKIKKRIFELKKLALESPKELPRNAWTVFMTQESKKSDLPVQTLATSVKERYHQLGSYELQQLKEEAVANQEKNVKTKADWIAAQLPEVIYIANRARARLHRVNASGPYKWTLHDPRQPKEPPNSFALYIKERTTGGARGIFAEVAGSWRAMTDAEKKPYQDASQRQTKDEVREKRNQLLERGTQYWAAKGVDVKAALRARLTPVSKTDAVSEEHQELE